MLARRQWPRGGWGENELRRGPVMHLYTQARRAIWQAVAAAKQRALFVYPFWGQGALMSGVVARSVPSAVTTKKVRQGDYSLPLVMVRFATAARGRWVVIAACT